MRIDKLYIENFKGIKNAEPNLGDLTIITGRNSSGKSSIIQAIKYITQWIKRIERTRGLDEHTIPALNIYHPDFVNENRDYFSVLNSNADFGMVLGFDAQLTNGLSKGKFQTKVNQAIYDEGLHFKAYFQELSKEGELVRPIKFSLRSDNLGDDKVNNYDVIYIDTIATENSKKLDEYIRESYLGQIIDYQASFELWNFENYMKSVGQNFFLDSGGKNLNLHYLYGNPNEELQDIKSHYIPLLLSYQSKTNELVEEGIIVDKNNVQISFDNSSTLKINKHGKRSNLFYQLFADYVKISNSDNSLRPSYEKQLANTFLKEQKDLKLLVKKIYKILTPILESENIELFFKFLQHDVDQLEPSEKQIFNDDFKYIKTLNKPLISKLKLPDDIKNQFESLANFINKSSNPEIMILITQVLSMFYLYIKSLTSNKSNLVDINKVTDEFFADNDIFTLNEQSLFTQRAPIEKIILVQNLIGDTSSKVGNKISEVLTAQSSTGCPCFYENIINFNEKGDMEYTREIGTLDVIRPCHLAVSNLAIAHIYTLTSPDEIKDQEPNNLSLYPVANFRTKNFPIVEQVLNVLNDLYFNQNLTTGRDRLFNLLYPELSKFAKSNKNNILNYFDSKNSITDSRKASLLIKKRESLSLQKKQLQSDLEELEWVRKDLFTDLEQNLRKLIIKLRKKTSIVEKELIKKRSIIEDLSQKLIAKEYELRETSKRISLLLNELNKLDEEIYLGKVNYLESKELDSISREEKEQYNNQLDQLYSLKLDYNVTNDQLHNNYLSFIKSVEAFRNDKSNEVYSDNYEYVYREHQSERLELEKTIKFINREIINLEKTIRKQETKIEYLIANNEPLEKVAETNSILFTIERIINTKFIKQLDKKQSVELDRVSTDIKFLNTGRSTSPLNIDSSGAFYDNLPVGKYGGMLADIIYNNSNSIVSPFLFPQEKIDSNKRGIENLSWSPLVTDDALRFDYSLNLWIDYLGLQVSNVESVMEGPRPVLKVKGMDKVQRNIYEVGSGVGQVLPVLALCLLAQPGELVCIEEPEAHLHPSAQAYLADFLISMAASGRQIMVETHSPNIIDRIRLRKAHFSSWKKLKNTDWLEKSLYLEKPSEYRANFIEPELRIIYADQDKKGFSTYSEAFVNNYGDIIFRNREQALWPEGFFDTTQQEISRIMQARSLYEEE